MTDMSSSSSPSSSTAAADATSSSSSTTAAAASRALFEQLRTLATEQRNPRSTHIDLASTREILDVINAEDHLVPLAVRRELPSIERAVDLVVAAFARGGRLLYVGAGTSGRLGIVDASECPPTFGVDASLVHGIMAGGRDAMFRSAEGAEDVRAAGERALRDVHACARDVVCGIAASGRTPFVLGAVEYARTTLGATTLFVTCAPRASFTVDCDVAVCVDVGPEVVMGSTRMKSGTAQKLVLNMLTTASMVRRGKVFENMMIDLQMTNAKLVERAKKIVMMATGVDYERAAELLHLADAHVKTAIVIELGGVDAARARALLDDSDGFVRRAVQRALTTNDDGGGGGGGGDNNNNNNNNNNDKSK